MKTLLNKWFLGGCLLWLVITIMRRSGHPLPVLNGCIDDLLAIPVIANLGLWFQRVFIIRNNYYVLSPWHVLFIVVYVSILFELALPYYSKTYTGDWRDVILYLVGGIFFYKIINRPIVPETRVMEYN
jgi:glycopeptide antibiotics resistance protein